MDYDRSEPTEGALTLTLLTSVSAFDYDYASLTMGKNAIIVDFFMNEAPEPKQEKPAAKPANLPMQNNWMTLGASLPFTIPNVNGQIYDILDDETGADWDMDYKYLYFESLYPYTPPFANDGDISLIVTEPTDVNPTFGFTLAGNFDDDFLAWIQNYVADEVNGVTAPPLLSFSFTIKVDSDLSGLKFTETPVSMMNENDISEQIGTLSIDYDEGVATITVEFESDIIYDMDKYNIAFKANFAASITETWVPGDTTEIEFKYHDQYDFELIWNKGGSGGDPKGSYTISKVASTTAAYTTPNIDYTIVAEVKDAISDLKDISIVDVLATGVNDPAVDLDLELTKFSYKITYKNENDTIGSTAVISVDNVSGYLSTSGTDSTFTFDVKKDPHLSGIPSTAKITKVELTLNTKLTDVAYAAAVGIGKANMAGDTISFTATVHNEAELFYNNGETKEPLDIKKDVTSTIKMDIFSKSGNQINTTTIGWSLKGYTNYIYVGDEVYVVDFIQDNTIHEYNLDSFQIYTGTNKTPSPITDITVISNPGSTIIADIADLKNAEKILDFLTANLSSGKRALKFTIPDTKTDVVIIKLDNSSEVNKQFEITYSTTIKKAGLYKNDAYLHIYTPLGGTGPWGDRNTPVGSVKKDANTNFAYIGKSGQGYKQESRLITWLISITVPRKANLTDLYIYDTINLDEQKFVYIFGSGNDWKRRARDFHDGQQYAIRKNAIGNLVFTAESATVGSDELVPYMEDNLDHIGWFQYTVDENENKGTLTFYFKNLADGESHGIQIYAEVMDETLILETHSQNQTSGANTFSYTGKVDGQTVNGKDADRFQTGLSHFFIKKDPGKSHSYATGDMGWNILVNTDYQWLKEVVVTDILPEGLRYQPGSFRLADGGAFDPFATVSDQIIISLNVSSTFSTSTIESCNQGGCTQTECRKETYIVNVAEKKLQYGNLPPIAKVTDAEVTITEHKYEAEGTSYYWYEIDLTQLGVFKFRATLNFKTDVIDYLKATTNDSIENSFLNKCYIDGKFISGHLSTPNASDSGWKIIDKTKKNAIDNEEAMPKKDVWDKRMARASAIHPLNPNPGKYGEGKNQASDGSTMPHIEWKSLVKIVNWDETIFNDGATITDTIPLDYQGILIIDEGSVKIYEVTKITIDQPEGKTIQDILESGKYEISPEPLTGIPVEYQPDDSGFTIDVPESLKGKMILITYDTLVNVPDVGITIPATGTSINKIGISYDGTEKKEYIGEGTLKSSYTVTAGGSGSYQTRPSFKIEKVSSEGSKDPIPGVTFTLTRYKIDNDTVDTSISTGGSMSKITSASGKISFTSLEIGYLYKLTETDTPPEYKMLDKPIYIVVGDTPPITDTSTSNVIDGTDEILIKLKKGNKYTYTIDKNGATESENKPPINPNTYDITLIIENDPASTGGPAFPHTGGIGRETTATIGIGLLLTSALASTVILAPNRKKDKDTESKLPKSRKRK